MELRVGGIYCLPNGRELIVLGRRENGHVSYRLSARTNQYEISSEGRLICDGKLTAWDVSNLTDTGRSIGVERIAPDAGQGRQEAQNAQNQPIGCDLL